MEIVMDIETNGLLDEVTIIHCLSYCDLDTGKIVSLTSYEDMKSLLLQKDLTIIGHNIIRYDIPVLEKLLGIKVTARLIDTLGISWYLYPMRLKHGLEYWGEDLGVEKPKIADWKNLTVQEYIHRCEEDVKINTLLWGKQKDYLERIYLDKGIDRILGYISFKLDCAREQEEIKWKLDVELCNNTLAELIIQRDMRLDILKKEMPPAIKYKKVNKPKVMYKKDGNLSEAGKRWINVLNTLNLPLDYEESVNVEDSREVGNPKSTDQIKDWLFSLGWNPCTFSYVKNKVTGEQRKIPQVYGDNGVSESVKFLYKKEPVLENLEGLSIINHRIGILEGFLSCKNENNFLKAEVKGFTNTMRFQHSKPLVNLPTIYKPYGKEVRGCLIAPDSNHLLCGSDMSSLEDNTKQHLMYFYDPEYVKEMRVPGFDPHLDIALLAGMLTKEQVQAHKDKIQDYSEIRKKSKVVNFSAVYGVGVEKMHLSTGMPREDCKALLETYWSRNWAVKKVAANTTHKIVDEQMWLWNPVSQFWYSLRWEKDKFSTLNQGLGCYCFDFWVRKIREKGVKITFQMHDEIVVSLLESKKEELSKKLQNSIQEVNQELKLNVDLGISIDYGKSYADIH